MGDNSLINSFGEMGEICISGIGDNSLINSFWKRSKYVKRAVPCEKFDHFFYFLKFFLYIY